MSCSVGCRHGSDPALLWLWCRPVATALIRPLAWEPPYAAGAVQEIAKRKNKTKQKKKNKNKHPKNKLADCLEQPLGHHLHYQAAHPQSQGSLVTWECLPAKRAEPPPWQCCTRWLGWPPGGSSALLGNRTCSGDLEFYILLIISSSKQRTCLLISPGLNLLGGSFGFSL